MAVLHKEAEKLSGTETPCSTEPHVHRCVARLVGMIRGEVGIGAREGLDRLFANQGPRQAMTHMPQEGEMLACYVRSDGLMASNLVASSYSM